MEQELLFLPENPWFIVEFVNTTGNTNGAGNQGCSGRINSSCSISVTLRVHELYYKPGMLWKD
jgi:hypothetical protein